MKTHENPEGIKLEIQSLENGAGDLIYLLTVKIKYNGMNKFTTVITEEFSYFGDASDRMSIEMDKWRNYQQQKNPIQWKQEFLGDLHVTDKPK